MIYVCTTNIFSLATAYILSYDKIKIKLGIPILADFEVKAIKESTSKQQSVYQKFSTKMNESKMRKIDNKKQAEYENAGKQLPIRTFKTNPKLKDGDKK